MSASKEDVGKLLAVALIDSEYSLLKASILPPKPATITLRSDGSFRYQLIRTFGQSVLSTISRIGQKLLNTHVAVLVSILHVAKGKIPDDLVRFKSDYIIDSDGCPMYVVNP